MCQFKPTHGLNPETLRALRQGAAAGWCGRCTTPLRNENSIDLVLFVNGIPVATRSSRPISPSRFTTPSTSTAIDRLPKDPQTRKDGAAARLQARALVHFAV